MTTGRDTASIGADKQHHVSLKQGNCRAGNFKSGLIDFVAGSLGGVALVYVGQPLDTVKVKMQTFPSMYKGMVDCLVRTVKTDGVARGLYAGTIPAVVANVAENSVLFAAYGVCQNTIAHFTDVQSVKELSSISNAWAGFFAAFFSSLTLCPTELIKCKLQAMREVEETQAAGNNVAGKARKRVGPWKLTTQILREQGVRGLFTGLSSTIAREMPGYFFFFGGYEATRQLLAAPGQSRDDIGWQKTMVAGAVGGTVLWLVIFPADVVKSRIQVKNLTTPALIVFKDIARREGIGALYNGLMPTLIRTIPATATLFVTVEYTKKLMYNYF
ncbi:mitochondrial ornithine transporter 1 [Harpegnathos saltator]|uniref:Mitochondrial ornithine transporter 1 n=1 Tax=Harpegnathos saltator TaxID=610380 RepID=E2BJ07_HARSA|nr:mitochondrial ornithine transporter 1 [Harpegnathos saltator]XP_011139734.1 mitochondrial ornithine transporter 1 [Harpegnathos saltator]EFN84352.1 Mitochondrial ornithine transporter 1 [Harpegnathos saltator]